MVCGSVGPERFAYVDEGAFRGLDASVGAAGWLGGIARDRSLWGGR